MEDSRDLLGRMPTVRPGTVNIAIGEENGLVTITVNQPVVFLEFSPSHAGSLAVALRHYALSATAPRGKSTPFSLNASGGKIRLSMPTPADKIVLSRQRALETAVKLTNLGQVAQAQGYAERS